MRGCVFRIFEFAKFVVFFDFFVVDLGQKSLILYLSALRAEPATVLFILVVAVGEL